MRYFEVERSRTIHATGRELVEAETFDQLYSTTDHIVGDVAIPRSDPLGAIGKARMENRVDLRDYVDKRHTSCPFCGSPDVSHRGVFTAEVYAVPESHHRCGDCEASWVLHYVTASLEVIAAPEGETE